MYLLTSNLDNHNAYFYSPTGLSNGEKQSLMDTPICFLFLAFFKMNLILMTFPVKGNGILNGCYCLANPIYTVWLFKNLIGQSAIYESLYLLTPNVIFGQANVLSNLSVLGFDSI